MPLEEFTATHNRIIASCAAHLQQDRFAVWVVGDVKDKKTGRYVRLQDRTKDGFSAAGMHLHSEMILVTVIGARRMEAAPLGKPQPHAAPRICARLLQG